MLTGSVRYEQLRLADSVMAPIVRDLAQPPPAPRRCSNRRLPPSQFFGGFIFVIFFVMVNYFLSILNDAYYTVHMNTLETKQSVRSAAAATAAAAPVADALAATQFWLDLAMAPLLCFGKGKRQRQSRADGKAGAGAAKDA